MNRTVLGAFAALLLAASGMFWWQGRAAVDPGKLPPAMLAGQADNLTLPDAGLRGAQGPALPEATEQTKEQRRFDRVDRNRDGGIARVEALAPRIAAFRKLDVDGNNLLTFEVWAVRTSNRFKAADANGDGKLDRPEFATTKPKPRVQPACKCGPKVTRPAARPEPAPSDEDEG